jgi:hypothetical protein
LQLDAGVEKPKNGLVNVGDCIQSPTSAKHPTLGALLQAEWPKALMAHDPFVT